MIDLAKELQADIERREAAFISKLTKAGLDALAVDYQDIVTLRQAVEVTAKRGHPSRTQKIPAIDDNSRPPRQDVSPPPPNFVLSDAVRGAIREIGEGRFRTLHVFEILSRDYPEYITEDKRSSISATLSNLFTSDEITKSIDGQRKVWYQVKRLRNELPGEEEMSGFDADIDRLKQEEVLF